MNTSTDQFMNLPQNFSRADLSIPKSPIASSQGRMDVVIAQLRSAARRFAILPIDQRIALAEAMQQGYLQVVERMVQAGCKAKGIDFDSPLAAEEWATGPWGVVRQLRLLCESMRAIEKHGNTDIGQ